GVAAGGDAVDDGGRTGRVVGVVDGDVPAVGGEPLGDGGSQAARRAGDECGAHGRLSDQRTVLDGRSPDAPPAPRGLRPVPGGRARVAPGAERGSGTGTADGSPWAGGGRGLAAPGR